MWKRFLLALTLILTGSGASTEEEHPIPETIFSAIVNGVAIGVAIEYAKLSSVDRKIELKEGMNDIGIWFKGWAI